MSTAISKTWWRLCYGLWILSKLMEFSRQKTTIGVLCRMQLHLESVRLELDFFCFSMIVIPNTLQIQYKHIWIGKHYQSWIPKAQTSTLLKQCWIILTENRKKRQATSNKEL